MNAKKTSLGIMVAMLFSVLVVGGVAHAQSTYQTVSPTVSPSTSASATMSPTPTGSGYYYNGTYYNSDGTVGNQNAMYNGTTGTTNTGTNSGTYNTTNTGTVGLPNTGLGGNVALTWTTIALSLVVLAAGALYLTRNLAR